jgi:hypothetical protein
MKPTVADRLQSAVNFDGFDDPKLTLEQALDYLAERYEVAFDVDENAFAAVNIKSVLQEEVAKTPIPKMYNVPLDRVVRKILARLPTPHGATYLLHRNCITITTMETARKEILGDSDRPLWPLVHGNFEKRLLRDALDDLSERSGISVVLDSSLDEDSKKIVSARFMNTPVDTAVRIFANMADLGMLQLDNMLYVTTRAKVKLLREELERSSVKELEKSAPATMPPADAAPGASPKRQARAVGAEQLKTPRKGARDE